MYKYYVFYHFPCNDGELSKLIWELKYPNSKFYKWDYSKIESCITTLNKIPYNSTIVFLDICPSINVLPIKMKYIIIDHHFDPVNSMNKEINKQNFEYHITMFCDVNKSGCMLTWEYCYNNIPYPLVVHHIGNKDIWNFSDINTESYCIGYNIYLSNDYINRTAKIIKLLENTDPIHNELIENGNKFIHIYKSKSPSYFTNKEHSIFKINNMAFKIIDIICNNSIMYKYLIEYAIENYDIDILRILHTQTPDKHIYSLRSLKDNVDVDMIARHYGGNGHPKAAGYTIIL